MPHSGIMSQVEINGEMIDKTDPLFMDPANMNFQLRDDSPPYKLGFQRISAEKTGIYKDEYRRQ
jgi:hypothetical protein